MKADTSGDGRDKMSPVRCAHGAFRLDALTKASTFDAFAESLTPNNCACANDVEYQYYT